MAAETRVDLNAPLIEVFSAIQGEGLNVGTRQIFIRFALCDLRCHFCDSAHTWKVPPTCRIEKTPGLRDFEIQSNPIPLDSLIKCIQRQNLSSLHDSISLTGGEPLLHATFLAQFLPKLKQIVNLPIYLETGGHRPAQLTMILPYLDSIGMDFKLPSVSGETYWPEHRKFLQLCSNTNLEIFVKIIVSQQTDSEDLEQASRLLADVNQNIPVFLQPVTPLSESEQFSHITVLAPTSAQVLAWQALMKRFIKQVRVIPQTHKMINQM